MLAPFRDERRPLEAAARCFRSGRCWTLALNNHAHRAAGLRRARAATSRSKAIGSSRTTSRRGKQLWLVDAQPRSAAGRRRRPASSSPKPMRSSRCTQPMDGRAWRVAARRAARRAARLGQRLAGRRDRSRRSCSRFARRTVSSSGSSDLGSPLHAPPALRGIACTCRRATAAIVALRVETGDRSGNAGSAAAPNEILALDDRLYVGSTDNFLYCLMAEDGASTGAGAPAATSSARRSSTSARVYFVSLDNVLRALNRRAASSSG